MLEHSDLPRIVNFSVFQISLLAAFFLAALLTTQVVHAQAFPSDYCSYHTCWTGQHRAMAMTLSFWEGLPWAPPPLWKTKQAGGEGTAVSQRVHLPAGMCPDGWMFSSPSKERKNSRAGGGQDVDLLTIPLCRGDHRCRAGTLPLQWIRRRISALQCWGKALGLTGIPSSLAMVWVLQV